MVYSCLLRLYLLSVMKYCILILLLIISSIAVAQEYNCIRVGANYQGMAGAELGYAHLTIHEKGQLGGSYCLYGSLGASFRSGVDNVYILKGGFETSTPILLLGIEGAYMNDFNHGAVAITPRAGVSIYGVASLTYGYSFIVDNPFSQFYNNQISLTINGSRKLWNELR